MTVARREGFLVVLAPLAWWLVSACGGTGNTPLLPDADADASGDSAPPPNDASSTDASSSDASSSDASSSDASAGDAASPCSCGPGQTCCLYTSGGGSVQQQACATTCSPPDGGNLSSLACTGSDCPNAEVCCIWRNGNDNVSQCKAACSNQNNEVQMCNASLADAGCPLSQPCSSNNITDWNLTPPLATCGGQGVP